MPAPDQKPAPGDTWPPPPTGSASAALPKRRADWFRPALWLGLAFNVLACWPALELLKEPYGSQQIDDIVVGGTLGFILFIAAPLALLVGGSFAIWQIQKRKAQGQPIWAEFAGLLLCLTPIFLGFAVLMLMLKLKAFHLT